MIDTADMALAVHALSKKHGRIAAHHFLVKWCGNTKDLRFVPATERLQFIMDAGAAKPVADRVGMTRKMNELYDFIKSYIGETGIPPSFDEMKDALDLRSKSGIHRLIIALEERGMITRLPNRARAIALPE